MRDRESERHGRGEWEFVVWLYGDVFRVFRNVLRVFLCGCYLV